MLRAYIRAEFMVQMATHSAGCQVEGCNQGGCKVKEFLVEYLEAYDEAGESKIAGIGWMRDEDKQLIRSLQSK